MKKLYKILILMIISSASLSAQNCLDCTEICAGEAWTTYAWGGAGTGSTQCITPTAAGVYTLTVTDANGCEGETSFTVAAATGPTCTPVTPDPICEGDCADIGVTATGGTAPYTYVWDNGAGSAATANVCPTVTTTYTVVVTDANGCECNTSVTVTVNPLPTPTIICND